MTWIILKVFLYTDGRYINFGGFTLKTIKKGDVRKNEILDQAENLFAIKGYEQATVSDILDAVGIGKGTFYYHFVSKEDVLDAIIRRRCDESVARAALVAAKPDLRADEKLLRVMLAQQSGNQVETGMVEVLHEPCNAQMHQKTLLLVLEKLTPVLCEVIEQGIHEGLFTVDYPRETIEFLLAAGVTVFDHGYFSWSQEEASRKAQAFIRMMERTLGAAEGSLAALTQIF